MGVPPSALSSLNPPQLVAELQRVIAAAPPLDEAALGRLFDRLVGLDPTAQEMRDSGAPPHTAHARRASAPTPPTPACPNAMAPAALPLTLTVSRPRTGACKLVNNLRGKRGDRRGASAALKTRADDLYKQWMDGGAD